MSYLEKLLDITDIEWKSLEEIASFRRGSFPQPYGNHEWYDGEGSMPFVQVIDVNNNLQLVNNTKKKISKLAQHKSVFVPKDTVIVTLQGSIGRVAITQYDCYIDRTLAVFEHFLIKVNKKYFAYQLEEKFKIEKETARGNIIKTITKEDFKKFLIPIPCPDNPKKSLEIQQKIVDILDKFTELRTKLIKELTTELTSRKQQYNYYREQLFSFEKEEVEWKPLGEIGELIRGNGLPKSDFTETGVPAIHYGQIYTYYRTHTIKTLSFVSPETAIKLKKVDTGDVIITNTSENLEDVGKSVVYLGKEQAVTGGHATIFKPSKKITGKFLAYYTQTAVFAKKKAKYAKGTKVIDVSANDLAKIIFPVPPVEEQERIVSILDKFDILINSISEDLPKEIELRQKQYEYYRDMLLTFPKDNLEA
ncbi:restriction endonuclease subunit S [Elizabethkingia anophelis]|nr:restriction endonuclease subunit S [Elizabethkingia anophelis]